jgi:bacillolysin
MKNILIILLALPATIFGQLKSVDFKADNFPAQINEQSVSKDLNAFFSTSGEFTFRLKDKQAVFSKNRERHVAYQQYYHDYAIEHAVIKLHYRDDELYYIGGNYLPEIGGNLSAPKLNESQALASAKQYTKAEEYVWDRKELLKMLPQNASTELLFPEPHAQLVIYCPSEKKEVNLCLAYKFDIYATKPFSRNYVFINAHTGEVMGTENRMRKVNGTADTRYSGQRTIATDAFGGHFRLRDYGRGNGIETYDMRGQTTITKIDFTDNDNDWSTAEFTAHKDNAALDAHWGAMMFYDYFSNVHGRNSIDDNGELLINYVHVDMGALYGRSNDNAGWQGTFMVCGDGGGDLDAVTSLDVVAHELGHGLCERSAGIAYGGEGAAIDEGMGDIWGACVENYATNDKSTWLIGEDITVVSPYYIKSFADPASGLDLQADTYGGTDWDGPYGEPHQNGGVMTHWFYLLSEGGAGTNDHSNAFDVAGIGIEDAAAIVYKAETEYMMYNETFASVRVHTIQAAQDLFGNCSQQVFSTIEAWYAVGVGSSFESINEKHITINVSPATTQDVYAVTLLEASNNIGASSNIRYQSSGEVVLSPEFSTDGATNFVAEIIPCIDLQNSKKDNLKDNTAFISSSKPAKKENDLSVKIFPNPTAGRLGILFHTDKVENAQVTISDANSRVVKSFAVSSKHNEVKIDELAAGFYFINIQYNGKVFSSKIIKN